MGSPEVSIADVSYDRRGEGPPLVLVHGVGSRWEVFEPVLDRLAESHDVISVDLPGHGRTPADPSVRPGPYGYADWLTALLAELGVERPHVVGNSMGGGIALELGRRGVAGRVTAFSPIGFWGTPGLRWTQVLLGGLRGFGRYGGPLPDLLLGSRVTGPPMKGLLFGRPTRATTSAVRRDMEGLVGSASFPDAIRSFGGYRLRADDDLGGLAEIPVTIAWGTRDRVLIHRTQSATARRLLPAAHHVDLPQCGHLPFSDDPDLCARIVLQGALS